MPGTSTMTKTEDTTTSSAPMMSYDESLSEEGLMSVDPTLSDGKTSDPLTSEFSDMLSSGYEETTTDEAEQDSTQKQALEDMGTVTALDSSFGATAGKLVDALVPDVGDRGKLILRVNVPVDATGTVKVGLSFEASVARSKKGVTLGVALGGHVSASKEIDAYFATMKAFAAASITGRMESFADNGGQAFNQLLLGIENQVRSASTTLADAMFTPAFIATTTDDMDDDDYVESSLTGTVTAGLDVDAGDDFKLPNATGTVSGSTAKKLSKKDGKLVESTSKSLAGSLKLAAPPFSATGTLTGKWDDDGFAALTGELAGEALMTVGDINEKIIGGSLLTGALTNLSGVISGGSGFLSEDSATRKAASLAGFVKKSSGLGALTDVGAAKALGKLDAFNSMKLGLKLSVKAKWDKKKGFGLDVNLDRTTKTQLGDNARDIVYVLLENIDNIVSVSI